MSRGVQFYVIDRDVSMCFRGTIKYTVPSYFGEKYHSPRLHLFDQNIKTVIVRYIIQI